MERVIKRFLLHNNRENDDIRESDFDELKQDVQMVRFEMLNYLRQNKEDAVRYTSLLHSGMSLLGDFACQSVEDSNIEHGFRQFQQLDKHLNQELDDYSDANKQVATYSRTFSYSKVIDSNNNIKEQEDIRAQIWHKLKKRNTNLSLKLDEIPKTENSEKIEIPSENENTDETKKIGQSEVREIKVKFENQSSYSDLNAINEEN